MQCQECTLELSKHHFVVTNSKEDKLRTICFFFGNESTVPLYLGESIRTVVALDAMKLYVPNALAVLLSWRMLEYSPYLLRL
jgi:hypothetical protein